MTLHWWHVTISYALVALVFAGIALGTVSRHRAARARLAELDPRA